MYKSRISISAVVLLLSFGGALRADVSSYLVSIDTSSLGPGYAGGIYLQYSPSSGPASVAITGFSGAALTNRSAYSFGGVSGTLDTNDLVFTGALATNYYGEAAVFGPALGFEVTVNLPTFVCPVAGFCSGGEFDIGLTESDQFTPVLTGDPSGFIGSIVYDQTGVFSTSLLGNTDISIAPISATPEPGFWGVLGVGLSGLFIAVRRRKIALP